MCPKAMLLVGSSTAVDWRQGISTQKRHRGVLVLDSLGACGKQGYGFNPSGSFSIAAFQPDFAAFRLDGACHTGVHVMEPFGKHAAWESQYCSVRDEDLWPNRGIRSSNDPARLRIGKPRIWKIVVL